MPKSDLSRKTHSHPTTISQGMPFLFRPDIAQREYTKLWQTSFETVKQQVEELKRPRGIKDITGYIDELNDLDIAITEEDVNGNVWKDIHPDLEFREEAAVAQRIFGQLMGEVMTSLEIAHNLAILENTEQPFTRDEKRLLAVWKRNLHRGGAYLNQGNKERVRDLTDKILDAEEEFLTNIREDSRKLELDSSILQGLPEDYLASHPVDPCTGKFTIDKKMSNVSPILMYCHEQSTREKVYRFLYSLGSPANESVLLRLLGLRRQKAQTLGYSNWAEYQIEGQMARTVICARAFIDDCARAITTTSDAEQNEMIKILREQDGIEVKPWDLSYGKSVLQKRLIPAFDEKTTRQYFPVGRVFPAIQQMIQDLFSLRFQCMNATAAWHPTVTSCLVFDTSGDEEALIGRLFFDIYTRDGKLDGACEYSVRAPVNGKRLAEAILCANFSSENAYLSLMEVKDLLHELGHCVHCLVGRQRFAQFAGIGEPARQKDFTEAPSEMLELWLEDPRSFAFAVNRQGESIPEDVLNRLLTAEKIGRGCFERSINLVKARYSIDMHTFPLTVNPQTDRLVASAYAEYGIALSTLGLAEQHGLVHLAIAGYGSLYYCYMYARVLSHDLFGEFVKSGDLMNKEVAMRYRKMILEKGSSEDAEDMVNAFLGREYSFKAYEEWLRAGVRKVDG